MRRIALVLLALVLFAAPALARGGPQSTTIYLYQRSVYAPVDYLTWCGDCTNLPPGTSYKDGTPWVENPGSFYPFADLAAMGPPISVGDAPGWQGCAWDSDDSFQYRTTGTTMAAGASLVVRECRYEGGRGGPYQPTDVWFQSASPSLTIAERWTWDGGDVTYVFPPPTRTGTVWTYFDCVYSPPNPGGDSAGTKVTIPASNGGQAIPQRLDVTITNPGKATTKTGGVVESGPIYGASRGCVNQLGGWHFPPQVGAA